MIMLQVHIDFLYMYPDYGVWTYKYVNVSNVAMDTNGSWQILGAESEKIDTFGGTKSGHIDTIRGSQCGDMRIWNSKSFLKIWNKANIFFHHAFLVQQVKMYNLWENVFGWIPFRGTDSFKIILWLGLGDSSIMIHNTSNNSVNFLHKFKTL